MGSVELAAVRGAPQIPDSVRSVAAIAIDGSSGHALAAKNADARLAPASLTKMMTALVAVRRASLADSILATERSRSEPSIIGLDPGDVLSLEDMLYGLLLPSGNDAALAIAENIGGGSIDTFVGWMNDQAAAMGLKNTHFANPHGLDQPGHYSSARDMAAIGRALMAEPALASIVATPRHVVAGPPLYLFRNSNPILGTVPTIDGIKTGFTDDAGRCFAVSATRDGRRIIAVVLNSPNIGLDAQALLDAEFAASRPAAVTVARPGFADVRVEGTVSPGKPATVLVGWEAPLLRAYLGSGGTEIFLDNRSLGRW
jgi:D-alanyl-D-alanine carboxypeptidase